MFLRPEGKKHFLAFDNFFVVLRMEPRALPRFVFSFEGVGRVSLCNPGCPQTQDPPVSGFLVLGLQGCTTMSSCLDNFTVR
jgi:hypothetical protein